MSQPFNIVFVCTDNTGRSLLSEYILRDYLKRDHIENIKVSSAGTNAASDISSFATTHFDELDKLGIHARDHKRVQISAEILHNADLVIVFDKSHQDYIKEHFGLTAPLFNKIYKNENTELKVADFPGDSDQRMIGTANYIHDAIPTLFDKIKRDYL